MTTVFQSRFARYFKWLGSAFVVLFLFRLIYGYVEGGQNSAFDNSRNFFSSIENLRKNYALEWTIKYYALSVFGLVCLSVFIFVLLLIIDKLNILKAIVDK